MFITLEVTQTGELAYGVLLTAATGLAQCGKTASHPNRTAFHSDNNMAVT